MQELRRDGVGQPDAVVGAEEEAACLGHRRRVYREDDGAAMTGADGPRGVGVGGQVDVVAAHLVQPHAPDDVRRLVAGAVVKDDRRGGGREL